jgi:Domain of unknown function (DUF4266)
MIRHALLLLIASSALACVTVKPQQRAILADPTMVFDGDPQAAGPIRHVYENREGSFGGEGVAGGGCGCN